MLNRRRFFAAAAGLSAAAVLARTGSVAAAGLDGITTASMRGSIDATEIGVYPGALDDQSKAFSRMLQAASDRDMPLFLPPGVYVLSNLTLPPRVRLSGVPGASRLVYGGDGHLLVAEDAEHLELTGIVIDGANRWLSDNAQGVIDLRRVAHVVIDNCQIVGSAKNGIALERVAGRIENTEISGAADAGIYSVEAGGLQITGNSVSDCANGGILVHRWQPADDGTIVSGNRVTRIGARNGGTGQNGNGINVFRANNVIVSNNIVSDCAFSAIRANSASNIQIVGNTCIRSGETGIYSEFSFEGAIINGNIVDGAANGISIVNFNEGGRHGGLLGQHRAQPVDRRPLPAGAARLRRRHLRGGRLRGHRQRHRIRAALRHADRLGRVHAQRRGHRQRHPQGRHRHHRSRWSKAPARPSSPTI